MFPRSQAEAVDSHEMQALLFGDGAPSGLIDLLTGALGSQPG